MTIKIGGFSVSLFLLGVCYCVAQPSLPVANPISASAPAFTSDAAFLEEVQHRAFKYFWQEANPANGLIRDRNRPDSFSSVAATGFGLTALGIGVDHGWISREQGAERALTALRTFWNSPQGTNAANTIGYGGWFYHFLQMDNAARFKQCELSSVDTALFLAGALYSREYFSQSDPKETEIRRLATQIYGRVDWRWMANGGTNLTMGWHPEQGFITSRWQGYNEAMILYLLGLGAATNSIEPAQWSAWTSSYQWQGQPSQGFVGFAPLFGHQFSHCWVDFRGVVDDYMRGKGIDYFENSRRATFAQRAYAIANPLKYKGYGTNVWGFTACDGPDRDGLHGYRARGAPAYEYEDGTIAPCAAGGSIVFTPAESIAALRHFYDEYREHLWSDYGFRDAFNLQANWWASDVVGIDQGAILLMIENHRNGSIWRTFMKSPEIQRGMKAAGFQPLIATTVATEATTGR